MVSGDQFTAYYAGRWPPRRLFPVDGGQEVSYRKRLNFSTTIEETMVNGLVRPLRMIVREIGRCMGCATDETEVCLTLFCTPRTACARRRRT